MFRYRRSRYDSRFTSPTLVTVAVSAVLALLAVLAPMVAQAYPLYRERLPHAAYRLDFCSSLVSCCQGFSRNQASYSEALQACISCAALRATGCA